MGLTKPRAAQIFDLDYKQSTRVVTTTNITLSGGAPSQVDSVNLNVGDRILVTGQATGSQNGIYKISVLGTGANGTWIRSSDGDTTGEIESGMIVMVTEGAIYADTQWKLITDDPITIGSTDLIFTQNYSANSISGGTSNVVVYSNANVTISSNGVSNVVTVSDTGAYILGQVSASGNVLANYVLGNGAFLTGVITSVANINNGSSNITVVGSGGNITVGVAGTSNVAVFASTGEYVTGVVSATGNIVGANIDTPGNTITGNLTVAGAVYSNLIPGADLVYSLGNATNRWSNLWLAGNTIYLGNSIITETANGDIIIENTGSFAVPVGTTAQRSEVIGAIRYNTTVGVFETYNGTGWNTLAYGSQTDFPFGDYGSVSDVATTDAFGVSIAPTFDCNSEGPYSYVDLGAGDAI